MRKIFLLFVIPALMAVPTAAAAGDLKLTIQNGVVNLSAVDVPLSTIMAEWARIGGTKIVNGEKLMTRVSMNLVDMPERRALDVLLRSVSGFMAAERKALNTGASVFDRIMILPTSTPPANMAPAAAAPPPFAAPRPFQPAQPMPDPDDAPAQLPPGMVPPGAQPMPPGAQPMPPGANPNMPATPMTLPRPGQLPAPQQPVPFGTPRPPGTGPGGGGNPVPTGAPGGGGGGAVAPAYEPDRHGGAPQAQ